MRTNRERFVVWSPDWECDEESGKALPNCVDAEDAAKDWMENQWSELDHPEEMEVFVRDTVTGQLFKGIAHAEPSTHFSATLDEVRETRRSSR